MRGKRCSLSELTVICERTTFLDIACMPVRGSDVLNDDYDCHENREQYGYFCYCFSSGFPNLLSKDVADNDGAEEEGDNSAEHESFKVT